MIRECRQHGYFRGERCVCGDCGELVLDDVRVERIGRFVSGALRHFPDDVGLAMSLKGWANLDLLVEIMQERYRWATKKHLIALVESDGKGRYEIENGRIRARYGHSTNVTLDFPDNTIPTLYYGTSEEEVDIILENGIKPLKQRYVHLSTDVEKAVKAASIHTEQPIIIEIDAVNSQKNNILMMQATDDIVLSEIIPAQYLRRL